MFGFAALVSQLLVLRYLYAQWPHLNHPLQPQTSSPWSSSVRSAVQSPSQVEGKEDGSFYGVPVSYHQVSGNIPSSSMQCIGDNFEPETAWMFRSCRFRNLCYDTQQREFVYIQSQEESNLKNTLQQLPHKEFMTLTTVATDDIAVSLDAFYPQMSPAIEQKLKWFPKIKMQAGISVEGFYELPSNVVWVPLMGSTFWSDLLPIFTLLSVFGLIKDDQILKPFLFLHNNSLSGDSYNYFLNSNTKDEKQLLDKSPGGQRSTLVCAKDAVAGIGMIADRGFNLPERWKTKSPAYVTQVPHAVSVNLNTHNLAQGSILKGLRDYILSNRGAEAISPTTSDTLVVSFHNQAKALDTPELRSQISASNSNIQFNHFEMLDPLSMVVKAKAIATSSVLIVQCCDEEAALAATFLAAKASVVIL